MAKAKAQISGDIVFDASPGGKIVLGQPTAHQWNDFSGVRYASAHIRATENELTEARVRLFDQVFKSAAGFSDCKTAADIPAHKKEYMIMQAFELSNLGISIKNS